MCKLRHLVSIKAPVSTVYKAITDQTGLQSWWTKEAVAEQVVGSIAEFRFGIRYHDKMKVNRLEKDTLVEWKCISGDAEWIDTTKIFDLEDKLDHTILRFVHGNWRAKTDFFASCNYHWAYYLRSLKLYCETGTPFISGD